MAPSALLAARWGTLAIGVEMLEPAIKQENSDRRLQRGYLSKLGALGSTIGKPREQER